MSDWVCDTLVIGFTCYSINSLGTLVTQKTRLCCGKTLGINRSIQCMSHSQTLGIGFDLFFGFETITIVCANGSSTYQRFRLID
jgi:hypothetical protein